MRKFLLNIERFRGIWNIEIKKGLQNCLLTSFPQKHFTTKSQSHKEFTFLTFACFYLSKFLNPLVINYRKKFRVLANSKNFLFEPTVSAFSDGRWVEIFAANTNEFPVIYHQREIFLCQAFFSSLKRKRENCQYWN